MPVSFLYAITILLSALLAVVAPHMRGLSFTLVAIFSICLVIGGLYDLVSRRFSD
ncbi:hypothetical protein [Brytella acorum]|uniref:Uncharacterized protein n=1 Tax=Brytella acorum TaxID=2959299 RepID=A0AA35UI93_9PROT|nr:hypothetical protein [Brytella acorum]MDF3623824.1 hypothetical protein [Brytella acorum]CAI9120739.1 hypothetical protein LMG32879_001577 [Brytella acorum]